MSLDWACRPKSDLLLPYILFFMQRFIHSQTLAARHYVAPMQIEHTVEKRFLSCLFSCSVLVKGWEISGSA